MQLDAAEKTKKTGSKKKKKSTRPKLRPLPAVDEDNLESGLGYGDIMVVPPPTPREKLVSDLQRLEKDIDALPKFSPEWFAVKEELALVRLKLDDWDQNTPTAAKIFETPILTTNAAYRDIVRSISKEEEKELQSSKNEGQAATQIQKKKKKKSSRKNRPKLKPQSVEKKEEEGDEEDGLGFNDILLTKDKCKPQVVDENTALLTDQVRSSSRDAVKSNVGGWMLRGVIGALICYFAFKFLLP